ncbi:hypothetical protein H696_05030 [Fonticula alba]|uniref:Peptidase M28 domain-containing protein n=1 Tax=Fonticula alba TaxID=691883 RepID=A0A058Z370_FONAL|nr:hypothetical protein H696_05030 [Fonticula alba]KCV68744.1 hypothetical protein H696_05030 [Fonticula alba]|eukprot:XP_009497176.1 hypothetical protein H696_05030 [Fonticula alba]
MLGKLLSVGLAALLSISSVASATTAPAPGARLIATSDTERQWMTESQVFDLIRRDVHFRDISDIEEYATGAVVPTPQAAMPIPTSLEYQAEVVELHQSIDMHRYLQKLTTFTSFHTRYYESPSGVESTMWLLEEINAATQNGTLPYVEVETFEHRFAQPSIIVRFNGTSKRDKDIVILGSHLDSINTASPATGRAPGADDDGSGTMTLLEIVRILVDHQFRPYLTLEFHFYAAEEVGLLGSAGVAKAYYEKGTIVRGMSQYDMTGYSGYGKIGLIRDYTDPDLGDFLAKLIDEYLLITYEDSLCGYGCSDHASWNNFGYRSIFTFEAPFGKHSPFIHTVNDTVDNIDLNYAKEFVKLGLAFAVEMSFP